MNIKPGILVSHPWYGELKEKGFLIKDQEGKPYQEFFWGGEASFIDFNNPQAKEWWKSQLKAQYLDHGCTGIWNDNNELELEDVGLEAFKTKALYPIRMAQASYEAFKEERPDERPWIYSRSGYAGLQRFARTWSGDNVSDWKTFALQPADWASGSVSRAFLLPATTWGILPGLSRGGAAHPSCQSADCRAVCDAPWRERGHQPSMVVPYCT